MVEHYRFLQGNMKHVKNFEKWWQFKLIGDWVNLG